MSGYTAAGADPEKPHTVHNGRVPKQSQDEEDIEAQESVGTASDGSGDSTDIPVEGGMTVAFKVCLPSPPCNSSPVPCKACADASIYGGKAVTVFSLQFNASQYPLRVLAPFYIQADLVVRLLAAAAIVVELQPCDAHRCLYARLGGG